MTTHKFFLLIIGLLLIASVASADVLSFDATYDGRMADSTDGTWAVVRELPGDEIVENPNTLYELVQSSTSSGVYRDYYRSGITWDTSLLPNDATITSATIHVYGDAKSDGLGTSGVSVVDFNPANKNAYVAGDFDATTRTRMATDITYANYDSNDAWNTFTLNAAGIANISKTGDTSFMFILSSDVDNSALTWATDDSTGFEFRGIAYSSGDYKPYLEITYTSSEDPYDGYVPSSISGAEPVEVFFTDISYNVPTTWNWTATDVTGVYNGGATFIFSTSQNPSYTFYGGNYSIRLNTTNSYGTSITPANITFVNVSSTGGNPPVASFTYTPTAPLYPLNTLVAFTDTSTYTPTTWYWLFESRETPTNDYARTTKDVSTRFPVKGTWDVTLTVANAYGSSSTTQTVVVSDISELLVPQFTPYGVRVPLYGYVIDIMPNTTLTFTEASITGSFTTAQFVIVDENGVHPQTVDDLSVDYTYDASNTIPGGVYPITLNYDSMASSITKYVRVDNTPKMPIVKFSATNATTTVYVYEGSRPEYLTILSGDDAPNRTVDFIDWSYNQPTSWGWTFYTDAGEYYRYSSTASFTYDNSTPSGLYRVRHTVTNDAGSAMVDAYVVRVINTVPPAVITSLTNTSYAPTSIQWNWTNPTSANFNHTMIWKNGAFYQNVSNTTSSTLWTDLIPETQYNISTKTVSVNGYASSFVNASSTTRSSLWNWTVPSPSGYYEWVCPAGVTSVSLKVVGGGTSGAAGQTQLGGGGGGAGEIRQVSSVTVVPYTTYRIYVGAGGATRPYGSVPNVYLFQGSNPGTFSSALGVRAEEGIPAIAQPYGIKDGGNGTVGYILGNSSYSQDGEDIGGQGVGGYGKQGAGAGGGGGASGGYGGYGMPGYVEIVVAGYQSGNIPNFVGSPLTSSQGTLVRFTDTSKIVDAEGLTYEWTFGDGTNASVAGDTQHVYAYLGSYDVSLNLTTSAGSVIEKKVAYINIVSEDSGKINTLYPREVSFTLVDKLGRAIVDLPVTAEMTSSSVSNTDWLTSMFGLSDTSINSTILSSTTDDGGQVVFPMIASGRYTLTFIDVTRGINEVRTVHPSVTNYIFILSTSATAIADASADAIDISFSTYPPASTNPATVYLVANYTDTSGTTTAIAFNVKYPNGTLIYTRSLLGGSTNASYAVNNTAGAGYVWEINATTSKFGGQSKGMGITLKGDGRNGMASNLIKVGCTNWKCD